MQTQLSCKIVLIMVHNMGYGQAGVSTDGVQHSIRLVPHPFRSTNNHLWHHPIENAPVRTLKLWLMRYISRENDIQILFYDTLSTAQLILSWMIWRYWRFPRRFILVACYSLYTRQKLALVTSVRTVNIISGNMYFWAHLTGRAIQGVGRRPLPCWDCGFSKGMDVFLLLLLCVVW